MTKTINRLPAILLAVIIAAALSFAAWASLQPAYADDGGALPPAEPEILIDGGGLSMGCPGQSFQLSATLENFPPGVDDQVRANPEMFRWKLTSGTEKYVTLTQDLTEPMKATLTVKNVPEVQSQPIHAYWAELDLDGKTYRSNTCQFELKGEYTELVYDRTFDETVCNLAPGKSTSVSMAVKRFDKDHPNGVGVSATIAWSFDPNDVTISPASAATKGGTVSFTVTRITADEAEFSQQATWDVGSTTPQYYNFRAVSYNLADYYIDYQIDGDLTKGDWKTVIEEGTQVDSDSVTLSVKHPNGAVVPEDAYDLKIEKIIGYDPNTFDDIVYSGDDADLVNNFPLKLDDVEAEDYNGNLTGGTAVYKVTATAKADSGYTGGTYEYILLFSNKSLNYYGADVDFTSAADKYLKFPDTFPYYQYEVPVGSKLTLQVKAPDGKTLKEGTDYVVYYINEKTGADTTTFPKAIGLYKVIVVGQNPYYGIAAPLFDYVKVGKKNPMTVKTKTLKASKKKTKKFKTKKAFVVKKAKGKVTYTKVKGNKKIKIAKNGKVTVKKGLKKGKTYKVKVKVSTPGTATYLSKEKTVTLKVKIKKK